MSIWNITSNGRIPIYIKKAGQFTIELFKHKGKWGFKIFCYAEKDKSKYEDIFFRYGLIAKDKAIAFKWAEMHLRDILLEAVEKI